MADSAPSPEIADEELAARRDVSALYGRYARRLLAFLAGRGVPDSDLEDAHHDVWTRVWAQLSKGAFEGHFRGWLFQIARNLAIDFRRKRRPEPLRETESHPHPAGASPLDELIDTERRARLEKCLERLTPEQALLVRGKLGGERYDEICARLSIAAAQAHKLFFNAKQKLEICLEGRDGR
jgi:RNA polymerase sigma-70 factor (ECF subfamily)